MNMKTEKLRSLYNAGDSHKVPVGLYNLGQTCCLNSLLQVFIMNLNFVKILKSITMPRELEEREKSVPYQLLLLLEKMQDNRFRAVRPVELALCLKKYVSLFIQHDAVHLFLTLWNLIQRQITDSELSERLKNLYIIRTQESLVCLDCNVKSHRNSGMLTLSLSLFDTDSQPLNTLEDSLHCFFQPKEISGENKCLCENCGKMACWQQAIKITHMPATLTLHLMRFSSKNFSNTQKIIHPLSFPQSLDFSQILPEEQDWKDSEGQVTWEDIKRTYGNYYLYWGETAYLLVYTKIES
ncbi:ubl carboxyl-terminal hydrolase 18 isoform X2 [Macrotis lagotis]|uniref:ubl carboxyl-terminal hydrolase 18 isoform X2 n=1 Tax=Macrotis lagotis TaxID=92651 RepID=UPI003D691602